MDQRQLDRIRLLSARFHELQGLRVAFTGACIAFVVGGYLLVIPQPTNNGAMVALAVAFVPVIPGMSWLNRYYAANFGRQKWDPPRNKPMLLGLLFAYSAIGFYLNARVPEIPAGGPTLGTVALASLFLTIRDWPWRAYYLAPAAAVGIGFVLSASGGGPLPPNLTLGILFLLVGASMVPVGILDHLLLVKLMKDARLPKTDPSPV